MTMVQVIKDMVTVTDSVGKTFTHPVGSIRIYRPDGSIKQILSVEQALKNRDNAAANKTTKGDPE